jgi:hypothetical protein
LTNESEKTQTEYVLSDIDVSIFFKIQFHRQLNMCVVIWDVMQKIMATFNPYSEKNNRVKLGLIALSEAECVSIFISRPHLDEETGPFSETLCFLVI